MAVTLHKYKVQYLLLYAQVIARYLLWLLSNVILKLVTVVSVRKSDRQLCLLQSYFSSKVCGI